MADNFLRSTWSLRDHKWDIMVALRNCLYEYLILYDAEEQMVFVTHAMKGHATATGSLKSRRHKRRVLHQVKVQDRDEALKEVARFYHRRAHKTKNPYQLKLLNCQDYLVTAALERLLAINPCQVKDTSFSIPTQQPTDLDNFDYMEIE